MTVPKPDPSPRQARRNEPAAGEPRAASRGRGKRAAEVAPRPRLPRSRAPFASLRRRRPDDEARSLAGPLAHQRAPQPPSLAGPAAPDVPRVDAMADRILAGVTARGEATARIDLNLNLGEFAGAQVDLVAGAKGIEVNVLAATAAARRVIQAKLSDLADALAQRGVYARKLAVSVRAGDNRGGSRQDGRR